MDFLNTLEPTLRVFWLIAIPTSLIFVVQAIMTFVGTDSSDGTAADFDGDLDGGDAPFQLFSFRNLINFFLGFSWTGISFYSRIENPILLLVLAGVVGILFVAIFFLIVSQIKKLAEDNSFKIAESLNKTADVYLRIPARMSGKGKIHLSVRGSLRELPAMTEGDEIPTGSVVSIIRIEKENILIVKPI